MLQAEPIRQHSLTTRFSRDTYVRTVFLLKQKLMVVTQGYDDSNMLPIRLSVSRTQNPLNQLYESPAIGPDDISPRVLKHCSGIRIILNNNISAFAVYYLATRGLGTCQG